ncbi:MAG: formate acetyltransferase [Deltaproteobacteria bacterium]|uniref:Formate acetyltransferase n=1 Tax=Candidatus Zymogenus saltonus TaxID=2844893 RepID=A0A9D8PLY6_9DELT|nr:formate acetyltransferase [Candidatus Zymogenus saltonus]
MARHAITAGAQIEPVGIEQYKSEKRSDRFARIKENILSSKMHLCTERAWLITEYFKKYDDPKEPMIIRKAKAIRHLLRNKSAKIFDDELIVGNVGSHRKSAIIQPELSGVFVNQELLWIDKRETTPFQIPWSERLKFIFRIIPYWLTRNMIIRSFFPGRIGHFLRYVVDQLSPTFYLINVAGGIGHFLPNYEKMVKIGIEGYLKEMEGMDGDLHRACRIVSEGLVDFAENLAIEAERQAAEEMDETRIFELHEIARILRKVPREGAETFHEAVQSLWLSHLTVCLEGINSAVSLSRVDQYLYPYYRRDMAEGRITREKAVEFLLCFSAKATEHVFHLSETISKCHGGYLVAQAAVVGGMDRNGNDAVNELTYVFLDVMERSGLRDPNYHARTHKGSPKEYVRRAVEVARKGNGVPGIFSDEAVISSLLHHGYLLEDARDYGIVGCVEPSIPGKSFLSTDTALFNLPMCLIFALNRGRTLKRRGKKVGADTPPPETFTTIEDVIGAFREQVEHMVLRMVKDLEVIDGGNRDFHPTPFSSMLVDGCIESGLDITAGGAIYNGSGVQGVGVADVADSLAAIKDAVFDRKICRLPELVTAMRDDFRSNPKLRVELLKTPKYGNDQKLPDEYADLVANIYHDVVSRYKNVRGGQYVPGFYSSTTHASFGEKTPALPSGRLKGMPFGASLSPANGMDKCGPTALLNSVSRVDAKLAANGYATNLKFDPGTLSGERGVEILGALTRGFFESGGMELQINVLDADTLLDARKNPGKYPGLVVRVAGYCAYFDDLPNIVKDEIIARTRLSLH